MQISKAMKSFWLIYFLFSLFTNALLAAECESLLANKGKVIIDGDFDPFQAFQQAGVNPKKVAIKIKNVPAGEEAAYVEFQLMEGKNEIGELQLYDHDHEQWGTYSGLTGSYRDKGVGSLMYMIGAEVIFRLYPHVKSLDSWDGSPDANFM